MDISDVNRGVYLVLFGSLLMMYG